MLTHATFRAALLAVLAVTTLACPNRVHAQTPSPEGRSSSSTAAAIVAQTIPGQPVDSRQTESIDHMLAFVGLNAALAGASSACETGPSDVIRQCTQLALMNWPDVSGYEQFGDPKAAMTMASRFWDAEFKKAHDAQAVLNPPMSCSDISARAVDAPALKICSKRPDAGPETQRPAATRPQIRVQ